MDLKPLKVNNDSRGAFVEAFHLPHDGQVSYMVINPKEMRGGHYHERKTEKFLVIYGTAVIVGKNRDTGDVLSAQVSGYKPIVVTMAPNTTHTITASEEGAVCMVWCDEQFNKKDPDIFQEEI